MEKQTKVNTHVRLTDSFAASVALPMKGKLLVYDATFNNLALRLTQAGSRSWMVRVSMGGKNVERTIGSTKLYSASRARDIAIEIVGELRQGIDRYKLAQDNAKNELEERRLSVSISQGLELYLERRTLKERTVSDYRGLISRELGAYADMPLREVTREFAEKLHVSLTKSRGGSRANKAITMLQSLCTSLELGLQSWRRFPKAKINARRTELMPEHGQIIWRSLEGRPQNSGANFVRALLLTGCRSGELKTLKAKQVCLRNKTVLLPNPKNGVPHVIRMSDQLVELISPLIEDKGADELVFVGAGDPRHSVNTAKAAVGVQFTPHDLRKLFAITLNSLGATYPTIKACLNHVGGNDVTLSAYAHATSKDMAHAWQVAADLYTGRSGITSLNAARDAIG